MFATLRQMTMKGLAAAAVLTASATGVLANSSVFQQAVRSTAWVISPISKEKGDSLGSGALVDVQRRLVVTNYHVVENRKDAIVFFPSFQDGEPQNLKSFYISNAAKLAIKGKVLVAEPKRDLAVIQLERLPEDAQAFTLARRSVAAGATIHVIGNSDANNGTLWRYSNGFVRGVFSKTFKTGNQVVKEFTLSARIVESQLPGNPGDSGGPVVNDQGELVAIHQGNNPSQQLVSFGVDITEVKAILSGTTPAPAVEDKAVEAVEEEAVEEVVTTRTPKIEDIAPKPSPAPQPPPARTTAPVAPVAVEEAVAPVVKNAPIKTVPVKVVPKHVAPSWQKPCHPPVGKCAKRGCH